MLGPVVAWKLQSHYSTIAAEARGICTQKKWVKKFAGFRSISRGDFCLGAGECWEVGVGCKDVLAYEAGASVPCLQDGVSYTTTKWLL